MLKLEFFQDIVMHNTFVKLQQNCSTNKGTRAMTMFFFSKNSHCDLDLGPRTLKLELSQDIVIINISLTLNQNRSINKGARVMAKFF